MWSDALALLPPPERETLAPLGAVLGRYGVQELLQAIAACRIELEQKRDETQRQMREKGRMYVGIGAAGAAVVAVLML